VAVPPERKSKPYRGVIVGGSIFIAMMVAILFVLLKEAFARAASSQGESEKARRLRSLLTGI
jgi:uncharacterized protein involved in exopolysaccharide biosynthesis